MSEPTNSTRTSMQVLESIERSVQKMAVTQQPLRKRETDNTSELYKALAQAQKGFKTLVKSGRIQGRNTEYAKINDLVDASRAALASQGLVVSTYNLTYPDGFASLVTRLVHAPSGQYTESELPLINNEEEQKRGSSITYAWRYTYAPLIGLVDNSCDDDGEITKVVRK